MFPKAIRIPLAIQVGAVAALFAAASVALWYTGTSVAKREERRASARRVLAMATEALVERGSAGLAGVRRWPYLAEPSEREELGRRLAREAEAVMAEYPGVMGGFFLREEGQFLPAFPSERYPTDGPRDQPDEADLYDMVETHVDAAIRKRRGMSVVEDVAPSRPVAVRTAPVWVDAQVVAAAWTMTRLVDPLFLDDSIRGYRTAAGLALGGIGLSLLLTIGLARTVRRQAEERARLQSDLRRSERLAALGKLLAGVAHEVRNPLAGIRSTAQLWQRGIGLDEESVAGLVGEVDRLEGIVSRLLHFSRADAQAHEPGDLNDVMAEAARLAEGPADSQGVRVEFAPDPGLPTTVMARPAILQIFRNLTSNAIQAMPGGGMLRLATRHDPASRTVEAIVSDTGPGLAPEALKHLFEPFFTTKSEGTGLGLAIAREIALAHRGDLRVGNRLDGTGAVFTLVLPAASSAEDGETT
jgi:signal transduction histidine kinase